MIKPVFSDRPPRIELAEGKPVLVANGLRLEIPKLKHGVIFITVSNIVTQCAFCEYKLHLDYCRGRQISRYLREGIEEHQRQLGVRTANLDFDIEPLPGQRCPVLINVGEDGAIFFNSVMTERWLLSLLNREKVLVEPALVVIARDRIPILAQPDMAIIRDEKDVVLIELKTTSGKIDSLRLAEILQVSLYGLLFRAYGFNVETYIVKMRRGVNFALYRSVNEVLSAADRANPVTYVKRGVAVHSVKLRENNDLIRHIDYAIDYWTYRRNPTPAPAHDKCKVCPHSKTCPFRLAR